MAEDYESMTVAQLKELLKERDLPVSGKKGELVARLLESEGDAAPVAEDAPAAADEDDSWDDEDWDDDEDDVYVVKQKPVLDDATKEALALRAAQKKKTPSFRRTEWFRYKRLSRSGWRAPHGMDNKQRRNFKYRGSLVRIGHGKVAAARFLHPRVSKRSWSKTWATSKRLILRPKPPVLAVRWVVASASTSTPGPMNSVSVC